MKATAPATVTPTTTSPHSPTLRVGDTVEFNAGRFAGLCGEITWVSLASRWVIVLTQDGSFRTGTIEEVSKV